MLSADVPCGSCDQCVMTSHNDLFLRTRAEYIDCLNSGGLALFLTYTYREDAVPYMMYYLDEDGILNLTPVDRSFNGDNVLMTFRKSHMQNYLKRLRYHFDSVYGSKNSLRYICVPEYGSQFTQRPHYHCIFFLDGSLVRSMGLESSFGSLSNSNSRLCTFLIDLFTKFWDFGIVSPSKSGLFINSESCMSYVTKYVCKNSDILKYSRFRIFFDRVCEWFEDELLCPIYGHDFKSPMSFFLHYLKFFDCAFYVVKSLGFGLSLSRGLPIDDPKMLVDTLDRGIAVYSSKSSEVHYLKYPKYILNKVLYDHRKDGSYFLNEVGLRTLDYLKYNSILDSVDSVKSFDFSLLDSIPLDVFDDYQYDKYRGCYVSDKFFSVSQIPFYIEMLRHQAVDVFTYAVMLRGRMLRPKYASLLTELFSDFLSGYFSLEQFISTCHQFTVDFDVTDTVVCDDIPRLGQVFCRDRFALTFEEDYGDFVCYRQSCFDEVLNFWTCITNYCRATLLNEYKLLNEHVKLLHDIGNVNEYSLPW